MPFGILQERHDAAGYRRRADIELVLFRQPVVAPLTAGHNDGIRADFVLHETAAEVVEYRDIGRDGAESAVPDKIIRPFSLRGAGINRRANGSAGACHIFRRGQRRKAAVEIPL